MVVVSSLKKSSTARNLFAELTYRDDGICVGRLLSIIIGLSRMDMRGKRQTKAMVDFDIYDQFSTSVI